MTTSAGTTGGDYCPACGSAGMRGLTHACIKNPAPPILVEGTVSANPTAAEFDELRGRVAALEAQARPPQTGPWKCLAEAESQRDAAIASAAGWKDTADHMARQRDEARAERPHGHARLRRDLADATARAEAAEGELANVTADAERRLGDAYAEQERLVGVAGVYESENNRLRNGHRKLTQQRDAERERAGRLAEYTTHLGTCNWWRSNNANCTCGLDAALALPASDTKEPIPLAESKYFPVTPTPSEERK